MTKLDEARVKINEIDAEISNLFEKRMKVVEEVIQYKIANDLPVFDSQREQEVLSKNVERIEDVNVRPYYATYLQMMMDISKQYQLDILDRIKKD